MAKAGELQAGDAAITNAGGPMVNIVAVKDLNGEEHAEVLWFGEKNALHKAMIPVACLKKQNGRVT